MSEHDGKHDQGKKRIDPETRQEILDHCYDGIEELDYPLPNWWLMMFYASILFAGAYFIYYELAGGPSIDQEYKREVAQLEAAQSAAAEGARSASGPDFKALLADAGVVAKGKTVYGNTCASCHGPEAGGAIGPNLADRHWLNGRGTPEDIYAVIRDGVPAKGMPPWGPVLKPDDLAAVAVYVRSVKGASPANAKAPQGEEIKE